MLNSIKNLFKSKNIKLYAPFTGKAIELGQVPDPVFAEKMVGDGIAIEPSEGMVVAPCEGKVAQIFPTNHAIGIETAHGFDLLIHIGIDTVELKGEGFERLVQEGDKIKMGDPLIKVDLNQVKTAGKHTITPFIVTNMDQVTITNYTTGDVVAGETPVLEVQLNKA